jgi:hypothetical protein
MAGKGIDRKAEGRLLAGCILQPGTDPQQRTK